MPADRHLTLGELDTVLATARTGETRRVLYDQFGLAWTGIHSWRGIYEYPALGWTVDYACGGTVADLKAAVAEALSGKVFHGYKGGEYRYHRGSLLWVDKHNAATSTALVGVTVNDYDLVLHTAHREP